MITNPNTVVLEEALAREVREDGDKDVVAGKPLLRRASVKYVDPDQQVDRMVKLVSSNLTEINAVLMERQRNGQMRPVHYPTFKALMESRDVRRRVLDRIEGRDLRDLNARLEHFVRSDAKLSESLTRRERRNARQLRETYTTGPGNSSFDMGLYPDEYSNSSGSGRSVFPVTDTVLPGLNSPYAKQQLFMDYLDMHRKSWEAATRNPLGKRIVDLIPQFVMGRGLMCTVDSEEHQFAWDQHWQRNRLRWRTRQVLKELLIYGEVFLRYFTSRDGLLVRSLDPSTIWDIVTDPDDIEAVLYYHQQYTLLHNSPVPGIRATPAMLIIRQIPGGDIDHFKINCTSSEKRGRSQLYTILGWLLRFKEFMNDRVIQNKMRAMFSLDVTVKSGDAGDIATVEALFAEPPPPGAVNIHNDAVEMEYKNANLNANDAQRDAEMLLKVIALGSGVSEAFLGVASQSTRAGALIQTEPDVKNFETYQEVVEDVLASGYERLRAHKKLKPTKSRFEVTFPALAQEDRSAKLKDIAFAESMDYFSKARAASMVAKEFNITNYNYQLERQQITEERAASPMMAKGMEQLPKITPTPDAGGGLIGDGSGTPGPDANPMNTDNNTVKHMSGQMGFNAKNLSGRGMADTEATLARDQFTRGGEKERLATNQNAGTPVRASAGGEPRKRNVWSDAARAKALETRRLRAAERQRQRES